MFTFPLSLYQGVWISPGHFGVFILLLSDRSRCFSIAGWGILRVVTEPLPCLFVFLFSTASFRLDHRR
ncbi:hypothetical protein B0J13DRAFT_17465 [Dactylonectria estremocensis]|uniref:Uncharacterized protein n=1 Tax=Dactylonectria estremocensis TaxID=1079267 RepID=A0A9P9JIE1_9HYPO|nr:hypothetical protein B0J13DRAFT_17465 [Dactylonectria estremocensis]